MHHIPPFALDSGHHTQSKSSLGLGHSPGSATWLSNGFIVFTIHRSAQGVTSTHDSSTRSDPPHPQPQSLP